MADIEEGGKFGWFLFGAAIGAGVALLYAPKTGKETRNLLSKKSEEGRQVVSDTSKEVMDRGREIYDRGKQIADDAAELFERGRKLVRG
jgi:gas vesicle protein